MVISHDVSYGLFPQLSHVTITNVGTTTLCINYYFFEHRSDFHAQIEFQRLDDCQYHIRRRISARPTSQSMSLKQVNRNESIKQNMLFTHNDQNLTVAMINASLQRNALEFPTNNQDKIHVHCVTDTLMGSVGDNDFTGKLDRERMEMKGIENGTKGSSFIFAWWLKLDPNMKNTRGNDSIISRHSLSLSEKNGFYLHPNNLKRNGNVTYTLLGHQAAKGKWIQTVFKTKQEGRYIRVMLKDEKGVNLITEKKIPHEIQTTNK
uniref:Uncharacterized protein n=1 Tax=Daphnia galeata TaxID=27404 RepID=A0A8J2RWQ2_9CRUS|nr:unnamed protein product [Daphnia galeata]